MSQSSSPQRIPAGTVSGARFLKLLELTLWCVLFVCVAVSIGGQVTRAATVIKTPPKNGLVGYWNFNEGTSTVALDYSGNRSTGTLVNSPIWSLGKLGGSLRFVNASSRYVDVGTPSALDIHPPMTITAWVKRTSLGASHSILGHGSATGYAFYFNGANKLSFGECIAGPPTPDVISTTALTDTTSWRFVSVVYDGANAAFYVDGVADGAPAYSRTFTNSDALWLGGASGSACSYLQGSLDEVRIYNRALTATEIKNLYKAGSVVLNPPTLAYSKVVSSLVGLWTFNGGDMSATRALDRAGTGYLDFPSAAGTPKRVPGRVGQGLLFDGTDDFLDANAVDPGNFSETDAFSFSAWVYPTASNDGITHTIASHVSSNKGWSMILRSDGTVQFSRQSSGLIFKTATSAGVLSPNTWYHVLGVVNALGTSMTLYINGAVDSTSASTGTLGTMTGGAFKIGSNGPQTAFFKGVIDEVRLYSRALTAAEARQLYLTPTAVLQ